MINTDTEIIKVSGLVKTYTTYKRGSGVSETMKSFFKRQKVLVNAVGGISFNIREGEICGILGPNGAGKSTAIKMLCGALFPTEGEIDVMGYYPPRDRKKYVNEIGAVFGQKSQLIWDIPPVDSFYMNKAIYSVSDKDYKERLGELTKLFDVEKIIQTPTRVLSLGERMKCEFIMAMLHNPKIVFLDEPTIGLDVIAKAKIREFIKRMNEKGVTFILTTHDLEDVKQLAHRVIVINHGKKVFDDTLVKLQSSLGEKKLVELVLTAPFNGELPEGTRLVSQKSDLEITLEVDIAETPIDNFIEKLSQSFKFSDISVKELPMDEIITHIYTEDAE